MEGQDFSRLMAGGLLRDVEEIVLTAHRELWMAKGRAWSRPAAYHWLRYEASDPVARLERGVERLRKRGARFDAGAVDKACSRAAQQGYSN